MQNLGDAIVSLAIVVLLIWTNPIAFIMIAVLIGGSIFVYDLITRNSSVITAAEPISLQG